MSQSYKKPIAAAGVRETAQSLLLAGSSKHPVKADSQDIQSEKARERRLRRQATQGVVVLFNAVRQHQSSLQEKLSSAGPLVFQQEKVIADLTTSDFLDRLSAGLPGSKPKGSTAKPDQEVKEFPQNTAPKRKLKNFPLTTYSVKIGKR
ncbi:pre-60S ribosomal particles component [Sparganum proliferum]